MWTGDKVISKVISGKTLEDINEVLRRRVVIWDNEHANDYVRGAYASALRFS